MALRLPLLVLLALFILFALPVPLAFDLPEERLLLVPLADRSSDRAEELGDAVDLTTLSRFVNITFFVTVVIISVVLMTGYSMTVCPSKRRC